MFHDARQLSAGTKLETELCIIGAGAAGITLALSLRDAGFRVLLLESGGLEFEEATQALYAGDNTGLPNYDLDTSRLRFFGGSTNHWASWCRPLEPEDFKPADPADLRTWPLSRADLEPYYRVAQTLCECGVIASRCARGAGHRGQRHEPGRAALRGHRPDRRTGHGRPGECPAAVV